jgi:hypothetical protein
MNEGIVKLVAEEMWDKRYSMRPWERADSDEEDGKYRL